MMLSMMLIHRRVGCAAFIWTVILCWAAVAVAPALGASKAAELQQKIADIALLHSQLQDRLQQAQAIRNELTEQQHLLSSEIHILLKSLQITQLQQARQHDRIRYNLELLRTLESYSDELDVKLQFYQTGRDRLTYLRELAEDDLKMIASVNDLKIDALTTQISLVINRYLPEAHIIQIDPQLIKPKALQTVWQHVSGAKGAAPDP